MLNIAAVLSSLEAYRFWATFLFHRQSSLASQACEALHQL